MRKAKKGVNYCLDQEPKAKVHAMIVGHGCLDLNDEVRLDKIPPVGCLLVLLLGGVWLALVVLGLLHSVQPSPSTTQGHRMVLGTASLMMTI